MLQGTSTSETREAAREIKFVVSPDQASAILEWSRSRLAPDPYAGGPTGDEYRTTTLYFDTAEFAVFRRQGSYRRAKYRIRRYGASEMVFLERKLRTATALSKRRTSVPLADLRPMESMAAPAKWPGHWFTQRLEARRLTPICQVTYHRHARVANGPYGPMRLTFDDDLTAQPCHGFQFTPKGGVEVLPTQVIIEMKYRVDAPAIFRNLVDEFKIQPFAVSKYRLSLEALRQADATTGIHRVALREALKGAPPAPAL